MEQKSSMRDFARYTILSVLGTLGVSCYILADTFFVSKGVGTDGLAALNLAIPVYNFIHGTGLMLGMGGATKLSVCKSQGKQEEVNRFFTNTVYPVSYTQLDVYKRQGLTSLSTRFGLAREEP